MATPRKKTKKPAAASADGSTSERSAQPEPLAPAPIAPDKPADDAGLSLEALNQAFAEMLGSGDDPYDAAPESEDHDPALIGGPELAEVVPDTSDDSSVEIAPRTILEAMLFVGTPGREPLTAAHIASLMRGVRPDEIDQLVHEMNGDYAANQCPYVIRSVGDGYRLELREAFEPLRAKFLGRVRQARLSTSAIEVLALVAYRGPLDRDQINDLRGSPSRALLSQLVRRELLAMDRTTEPPRRTLYHITPRFLQLFGLKSLEELPRGHDIETR